MLGTQQVVFYEAKSGNAETEWEDGAAAFPGDPATGRDPRFAVADGATQGFASARWAQQLVAGFVGADDPQSTPALTRDALYRWVGTAQGRWRDDPRSAEASSLQRIKLETVGSFATFLGCELSGVDGSRPRWTAVAIGDSVLFHVRRLELLTQFPNIPADGFGYNPDGLSTRPQALEETFARLAVGQGELADGDRLYLATDAFAHWMVRHAGDLLWTVLDRLEHPAAFRRLVADQRRAGAMTNDDVTLMRVRVTSTRPTVLVVCL